MNEVHRTTIKDRLANAIAAFKGHPLKSLTYGVELKRCDKCDRVDAEKLRKVFNIKEDKDKEWTKEQQKLYNQTVERLARIGAKSPISQIIALAEEIEYYREKIQEARP